MPFSFSLPPPTITIAVVNFWKVSSSARRLAGVKMLWSSWDIVCLQIQFSQSFIRLSQAVLSKDVHQKQQESQKWNMYMKSTKVFQKSIKIYFTTMTKQIFLWELPQFANHFRNDMEVEESEMWVSDLYDDLLRRKKSVCLVSPIDINIRFLGSCLTFPPPLFLVFSPQHSRSTWSHLAFLSCG